MKLAGILYRYCLKQLKVGGFWMCIIVGKEIKLTDGR